METKTITKVMLFFEHSSEVPHLVS